MKVWVDCTAAAHPLVLRPIIERLQARGHEVWVTAREYGQTAGLLDRLGHPVRGRGTPCRRLSGAQGGRGRVAQRRRWRAGRGRGASTSRSRTARSTSRVVSALLRIPSAQMQDYEFAGLQRQIAFRVARRGARPDAIPLERLRRAGAKPEKLFRYPGLKEDYYLADFEPDPRGPRRARARPRSEVLVVVRPPPETSAYHAAQPALRAGSRSARAAAEGVRRW